MGQDQLNQWRNGLETRIDIGADIPFGKLNLGAHPSIIPYNEFTLKDNLVNRVSNMGALSKRYGIQRHSSNSIYGGASNVVSLWEARFNANNYLLGKDDLSSAGSDFSFVASPFTAAWTNISTVEEQGYFQYAQFGENIYIANRLDGTWNLLANKVWQGSTNYFEHGCVPAFINNGGSVFTGTSSTTTNGGLTSNRTYYYACTFLYDGYQESATTNWIFVTLGVGGNTVALSNIPVSSSSRVKARKLYRSTGRAFSTAFDYPSEMYYLTTITDNTTTGYTDYKADIGLIIVKNNDDLFNQKKPYRSKYITVAKDRLIEANLKRDPTIYSAITTGDFTTFTAVGATGSLTAGTYKYRFYKAYASHGGGNEGWILGDYLERSIVIVGAGGQDVSINIANSGFSDWQEYIFIERTKVGGSDFYSLRVYRKGEGAITDSRPDSDLDLLQSLSPTIIKSEQTNITDFKGNLAISDVSKPDLFDAINVKIINAENNQGITGIFSEETRCVIFSGTGIYTLDTRAQSSEFWTVDKAIDNIGALGKNLSASIEATGHSGIIQLPENSGYIFFNRAYSDSASNLIRIYYWNGNSNQEPKIISDDINTYINGYSSFNVRGMCYDHINSWVWINVATSSKYILIYDLKTAEWFVFTLNASIDLYDVICTSEGKIIIGGGAGYIYSYIPGTFQDNYGSTPTTYAFTAKLQTKHFDDLKTSLNAKQIAVDMDTASGTTTSSNIAVGVDNAETLYSSLTTASGLNHRLKKRFNHRGNRLYFRFENAENKDLIINRLAIDIKHEHGQTG